MTYLLIGILLAIVVWILRSSLVTRPSPQVQQARSAERFFPPHLRHRLKHAQAQDDRSADRTQEKTVRFQISPLKLVLLAGVVMLLAYIVFNMMENRRQRLAAEAVQQAREAVWAAEQVEIVGQMRNDTDLVSRLVRECILTVERNSSSIFGLLTDRRDVDEVRRLLGGLHPYDIDRKLAYVRLEQMIEQAFLAHVAARTAARHQTSGEAVIDFAVTYHQEGFAGMRQAWGILNCPLRGTEPHQPRIENLYME